MAIIIRNEQSADAAAIADLTRAAFQQAVHASGTEQLIVNALRQADQLSVSLVAVQDGVIAGHAAISPVTITDGTLAWYGLGPVSVAPECQRQGIGSRLVRAALAELRQRNAGGCVVLGDPAYYGRFGFAVCPGLNLPGVPPAYFQAVRLAGAWPVGAVTYHAAFDATE